MWRRLERLRAEFLSMVSHELREPLTSIKGSAVNLRESLDSLDRAEVLQFVRIIESQSDRMRDLIGELLDVARIKTGSLSVAPEPAEVIALVDEARNTFLTGGRGRDIVLDLEPDLPWVMADKRRIVQVLGNLLSNAVKLLAKKRHAIRLSGALDGRRRGAVRGGPGDGAWSRNGCTCSSAGSPPPTATAWIQEVMGSGSRPGHLPGNRGSSRRAHLGGERGPGSWAAGSPSPCPWPKEVAAGTVLRSGGSRRRRRVQQARILVQWTTTR